MKTAAFILSHYKEREQNITKIIESLISGSVKPDQIIVFNDNPEIDYYNYYATCINCASTMPVFSRFSLGSCLDADRILYIDDDLSVGPKTLENFIKYANKYPDYLLGLEGNILSQTSDNPYTDGLSVDRGNKEQEVDIIIRTYFVNSLSLAQAIYTRELFKDQLPKKSVDDVILCMSNKYQYSGKNLVIPVNEKSDVIELNSAGVGQCTNPEHYINRNLACKILR